MKVIQNQFKYTEKELEVSKFNSVRRDWLITDMSKWDYEFKSNVICKMKIDIEYDLWEEITEIVKKLDYNYVYGFIKIAFWPTCEAAEKLKQKFKPFEEDIEKFVIIAQDGDKHVVPHCDPTRQCSFYIPLWPRGESYAPLELYHNGKGYGIPPNDSPIVYGYNTAMMHSVIVDRLTENRPRYNIQASIKMDITYQQIFQKYKDFFDV